MNSDQIIKRELLTSKILGRDIKLEYNFHQCQRQCSENSGFSKLSEDFYSDPHDSKTLQQFDINGKRSEASSNQSSFRISRKGSSKQLEKLMADKGPSKTQSAFSRRKILISNQSRYSQRNVQIPQKEKGIIHVIKRYWLAKRFINNMLKHSYVLSSNLKMKLDEDLYDFSKSKQQQQVFNSEYNECISNASEQIHSFWDFFSIFISLFSFWIVIFMFSFEWKLLPIDASILLFIIFDCLIDSRRAIIVQGEIIVSKPLIFQRYRNKQALEDIIYILGWITLIGELNTYYIVNEIIYFILVVISLKKLYNKYSNYINSLYLTGETNSAIYDLLTLIVLIITFGHAMASIWHYVGRQTLRFDASVIVRYNYSFYWATMTMVTVGYGDITPQNQWEMLVANILMLCSTCMFAYSMNSIGIIVKNLYDTKQKFKRSLIQINTYMIKNNVNQGMQEKIRNYIKFQLQKQLDENQEELDQILSNLPTDIITELNQDIQSQIVQKIHIVKSFSQQTQNKFASNLKSQQLPPKDSIYQKYDINTNLYYIQEGEVEIFQEQTGKVIFTLQKGECFGFHSFFTGQPTEFSIRTVGFAQVYKLDRSDALKIVQMTAKDWELFHHVKDNMIFNADYSALNLICKFCKNYGHLTNNCPKITYQPNLESVYKKLYIDDEYQERETEFSRQSEKINSLRLQGLILNTINQFNEMRQDEIDEVSVSKQSHSPIIDQRQEFLKMKPAYEDIKAEFIQSDQHSSHKLRRAGSRQQRNSIQYQMGSNMNNIPKKELPSVGFILESNMALMPSKSTPSQINFDLKNQLDLDRMKNYTDYMPQNNVSLIVGIYNNLIQKYIPTETLLEISKYTFNYKVVSLIAGIRQKLQNRKIVTPSASIILNKNKQLPKT